MGEEDNPIQDDGDNNNNNTDSTVHEVEEEDGTEGDDESTDDDEVIIETVDNKEEDELIGNDGNDGAEDVNSDHTMNDESSSGSEYSDEYIKEETAQPMIIQQEHKIQVKFENKSLGMKVHV